MLYNSELLALVARWRQNDIVLEVKLGIGVTLARLEIEDKIVLDSKDGVSLQPRVVLGV